MASAAAQGKARGAASAAQWDQRSDPVRLALSGPGRILRQFDARARPGRPADAIAFPSTDCPDQALEDQRGKARAIDADLDGVAGCDIGAVEYDPAADPMPPAPPALLSDGFENPL